MMTPNLIDHLLAITLLLMFPLFGKRNFEAFRRAIAAGGPDARERQYWQIIRRQWCLAIGIVAYWLVVGRSLGQLGLVVPGGARGLAGLAITLLVLGSLYRQVRTVQTMELTELARLSPRLDDVAELLPHSDREATVFRGVAVTAGVCEELVYRGFLIAYLAAYIPVWPAAIVAGVGFGIAHVYQGMSGILKTGATGLVSGLVYVGTGSLLWPILLHAGVDLHGGAVGRRLLRAASAT